MSDKHAVRVYVPDAVSESVHKKIKWYLSARVGGFTAYPARGGWIPDDEKDKPTPERATDRYERMVREDVTVYESVTDRDVPATIAKGAAKVVKENSNEDAVMWEVREVAAGGMV